jgi:hypothetical protein
MGTSTNQSSPNIPTWRLATAILGRLEWPAERQSREIWRAATSDREGRLYGDLGDPLLVEACRIAESGPDPISASQYFHQRLNENHAAGLALEMAQRALVRAAATRSGASGFASELFAEAASYYVSRDLPSFVGQSGRVSTTSEAVHLKDQIRTVARETALRTGPVKADLDSWQGYVARVIAALQGAGRKIRE